MDSSLVGGIARHVIAEVLCIDDVTDVTDEKSFIEDFSADLVELEEIVLNLEGETGIKISDEELASFRTVGDFVNLAKRKNDARQSS
jgi:acyl carrier protein